MQRPTYNMFPGVSFLTIWMLSVLRIMVSEAQLPINNTECPADIGEKMRELRKDYVTTYWEHKRLVEENKQIKIKYEKEIQEIYDKFNTEWNELTREISRLDSLIDWSKVNYVMDCNWYHDRDPTLKSGVYELSVEGLEFPAYCDMETADPGWTVIQRRQNKKKDQTDFYRYWKDYRDGFGDPADDYWLGNVYLHLLTKKRDCQMKIELVISNDKRMHTVYNNFSIGTEQDGFRLNIGNDGGLVGVNTQTVDVGDRVELECTVLGSPKPKVIWSRLDGPLPATSLIYDVYLIIPKVRLEDSGTYVCTAENRFGIDKQRVTIFVRDTTRKNLGCGNLYTEHRGLVGSNGLKFSTRDRNNQNYYNDNYAALNSGAWWYVDRSCICAGLNDKDFLLGYRLTETEMKLKCDLPKKTK